MAERMVYVVQEICWEYNDEEYDQNEDQPLKAFTRREAAETYRREKEKAIWEDLISTPPVDAERNWPKYWSCNILYTFGNLSAVSSLTEEAFRAKIEELGLPDFP